ncbi:MAG: IS200/IS605 family transposase [Bacteroidetes bacterium]|nr:IS200/IS605 family transposase [Bacteroidota bacterium]
MANTYTSCYIHCVFTPQGRKPILTYDIRESTFHYIGGIANNYSMRLLAAGGLSDHVHLLISLSPEVSISKALQIIKSNSSRWIRQNYPSMKNFRWQEGFGAFSVGVSQIDRTRKYLKNQETHHRRRNFKEEYLAFLVKHGIAYDERYVLG